jgi:hypothetical protein
MTEKLNQEKTSNNHNLEAKFLVEKKYSKYNQLIAARVTEELKAQKLILNNQSTIKSENNKIS